jgi:alpha-1,2-mannosyltransferase
MDRWQRTAYIVWGLIVLAGVGRAALYHLPRHCGCYDVFADGGRHWLAAEPVYDLDHPDALTVFRYSPLVAAGCTPLALLTAPAGSAALRFVSLAILVAGLAWWGKVVLRSPPERARWWLLVAVAGGPALLDVQLNLLALGLMLVAAAAFTTGRLNLSAGALSLAVCLKAYPVALAMLLILIQPRRFGPRFVAALLLVIALPFALQSPGYVTSQYHDWLFGGLNPRYIDGAFQDVMFLWQRWVGPMDRSVFTLLSVAAGAAIAVVVIVRRHRLAVEDQVVSAFGLATAWMMAFGPATEATTYVLLAPSASLAVLQTTRLPARARWLAAVAYGLLALSQLQLLFPLNRPLHRVGAQPFVALLVLAVFAGWRSAKGGNDQPAASKQFAGVRRRATTLTAGPWPGCAGTAAP